MPHPLINWNEMKEIKTCNDEFLWHCKFEKSLSRNTLKAYELDLRQFINFQQLNGEKRNLQDIDKALLRAYIQSLTDGNKAKTVKRKIATLKAMFNFFEYEDELQINPFRKMRIRIREPLQLPVVMDQAEIRKILQAAYSTRQGVGNRSSYGYSEVVRDIAVLELLFATGLRVSELCQLRYSDINMASGSVSVIGKGSKERSIHGINHEARNILLEYFKLFQTRIKDSGYFFINRLGKPLSSQSVRYMVRKYTTKAKLTKHITPHTFRHTFATLLLEADVDIKYIQHFLGHSSIMTTQIYTHVNKRKQRKILMSKHPRSKLKIDAM